MSAHTGAGMNDLHMKIAAMLEGGHHQIKVYLPYSESALLNQIRQHGKVLELDYQESCVAVAARVEPALAYKLLPFVVPPEAFINDNQPTKEKGAESADAEEIRLD